MFKQPPYLKDRWCPFCELGQFFYFEEAWSLNHVSGLCTGSFMRHAYKCNKCEYVKLTYKKITPVTYNDTFI